MPAHISDRGSEASVDELIAQSEELREHGDLEGSARALDRAYRQMPMADRVGMLGRLVVVHANADYRDAQESLPEDRQLAAQHVALLVDYIDDLDSARAAGEETAQSDEDEQELRGLLAEYGVSVRPGDEGYLRDEDYELPSRSSPEGEEAAPEPSPERRRVRSRSGRAPRRTPAIDPMTGALLGGGAAAFVGGAVLLGLGAAFPAQLAAVRDEAIETYEYEDGEPLPDNWREHETAERRQGIAMLVCGSIVSGAGIAAVAWGSTRVRRARSGRTSMSFPVSRHAAMVAVRHRF